MDASSRGPSKVSSVKLEDDIVAEARFELATSGLWAQRAGRTALPRNNVVSLFTCTQ